jgi:hypothetical protein
MLLSLDRLQSFTKVDVFDLSAEDIYLDLQKLIFQIFEINNTDNDFNHLIANIIVEKNIRESVVLEVQQFTDIKQIIEHMFKIADIIVKEKAGQGYHEKIILIDSNSKPISKPDFFYFLFWRKKRTLNELFDINKEDELLVKSYKKNPEKYVYFKYMKIKNKTRKIYTYRNNKYGLSLRKLHEKINEILNVFPIHKDAYAYKRNTSIKEAISKHIDNSFFLKIDIKDFFNSISRGKLIKMFKIHLDENYYAALNNIFKLKHGREYPTSFTPLIDYTSGLSLFDIFFIKTKLPVGFVTSPTLSNIFMYFFDQQLEKENFIYTRYADDILISSKTNDLNVEQLIAQIKQILKHLGLIINEKKTQIVNLYKKGKYIKYLGIVISKHGGVNKLSVSKSFIRKTIEMKLNHKPENKIIGRENFIKQISEESYTNYTKGFNVRKHNRKK